MRHKLLVAGSAAIFLHLLIGFPNAGATGPYDAQGRFQGRIAYSADGNHNDPDDWAASPVTLAILAEAGLKDRLMHFDYNCILPLTDPDFERKHAESVLGAAERYGYDKSLFFDCRKNLDAALDGIARAINDSSAGNPLYFIIAGPMEVPYRGIQQSNPEKRKFVYCISHSRWNDGFASRYKFTNTKRSVIEQGVHWVQIRDQNRVLSLSPYGRPARPKEFAGFFWMRDAREPRVRFLWERMLVSTRPDPSDAGMTYFLATGNEECDSAKLQHLIELHEKPKPIAARKLVRLEAENFTYLENCALEDRNDKKASHFLNTRLIAGNSGRIRTKFDEPFTANEGRYTVSIRFLEEAGVQSQFSFFVNGLPCGAAWKSSGQGQGWRSQTFHNVQVNVGDEIGVDVAGAPGRLDYVQLELQD